MKTKHVVISEKNHSRVKIRATQLHVGIQDLLDAIIDDYFDKNPDKYKVRKLNEDISQ